MPEKGQMWVDTVWVTRRESVTIGKITREASVGMSVKNDYQALAKDVYSKADKAVEMLLDQERAKWLNQEEMKEANKKIKEIEGELYEDRQVE
mgnify:CR=1 FL=1